MILHLFFSLKNKVRIIYKGKKKQQELRREEGRKAEETGSSEKILLEETDTQALR